MPLWTTPAEMIDHWKSLQYFTCERAQQEQEWQSLFFKKTNPPDTALLACRLFCMETNVIVIHVALSNHVMLRSFLRASKAKRVHQDRVVLSAPRYGYLCLTLTFMQCLGVDIVWICLVSKIINVFRHITYTKDLSSGGIFNNIRTLSQVFQNWNCYWFYLGEKTKVNLHRTILA